MNRTILLAALCLAFIRPAGAEPLLGGLDDMATLKEGRTMRSSSSDPNWRNGNADNRPILPGETLVLADLEGPGVIRHIWNTVASQERGYARLLVLRMYWDGEEDPSVEAPLGDFFAVGHGRDEPVTSLPVQVSSDGRARNCYWPMPFRESARITVTNEGRKPVIALFWYIDWQKLDELPPDTAYFHARYRQEFPAVMGRNYLLADIEGRGHYAGTVLSVRQHRSSWWGEGDDFFFIDGEAEPSLRGTGTEDYFCDAWGFRQLDRPYYGVTIFDGLEPFDQHTVYRWHIPDPVNFQESLRVEIEHKGALVNEEGVMTTGFTERQDDFSSVAYWYQLEPHKPFEPMPVGYERLHYSPDALVEAEAYLDEVDVESGQVARQEGMAWLGGAQVFWTTDEPGARLEMPLAVSEAGPRRLTLLLTRSYDYGIFQVLIDGEPVGEPLDLYADMPLVDEFTLPVLDLDAGEHTIAFVNTGKSDASTGYYFGFDAYYGERLTPAAAR